MAEHTISLKLLIDKSNVKRVVFAEAREDLVDFLFHLLALPVATIIRLLQGREMPGSFPSLFQSLENLNDDYIQPNQTKTKDTFLKPVSGVQIPLLDIIYAQISDNNFYGCRKCGYSCADTVNAFYVTDDPSTACPRCHIAMTDNLVYVNPSGVDDVHWSDGSLVKEVVTYMVMDDLVVLPMSSVSAIALLDKFGIKDVGALEENVVNFGINEALKLLKASLGTKNVLTEVFC